MKTPLWDRIMYTSQRATCNNEFKCLLNVKSGDETGTNVNTSLGSSSRSQKISINMK